MWEPDDDSWAGDSVDASDVDDVIDLTDVGTPGFGTMRRMARFMTDDDYVHDIIAGKAVEDMFERWNRQGERLAAAIDRMFGLRK